MAMQRFSEFFRRKNYGALWNNLFNFFHLAKHMKKITSSFGVDYFLLLLLFKLKLTLKLVLPLMLLIFLTFSLIQDQVSFLL